MEFKKCERCGSFFVSNNNICCKCSSKDENEKNTLKNYFENNNSTFSLEEIAYNTGITLKNLNRYINTDEFKDVFKTLDNNCVHDGFNNVSINL